MTDVIELIKSKRVLRLKFRKKSGCHRYIRTVPNEIIIDAILELEMYMLYEIKSVPEFTNITKLCCRGTNLTSLPLLPKLKYLDCSTNSITTLPAFPDLQELRCFSNLLKTLPNYPNLIILICRNNPLPYFDLDSWIKKWKNVNIFQIYCSDSSTFLAMFVRDIQNIIQEYL